MASESCFAWWLTARIVSPQQLARWTDVSSLYSRKGEMHGPPRRTPQALGIYFNKADVISSLRIFVVADPGKRR